MSDRRDDPNPEHPNPEHPNPEHPGPERSNLERRYRLLLRLLPAWYRVEREEEMVGIFLADRHDDRGDDRDDDLDLEHGWPGWGEAGATAALAVRVRFAAGRPAGGVVRALALAGLVGHLVLGGQGLAAAVARGGGWTPWFDALALAAFTALTTDRRGAAKAAVALLGVLGLVSLVRAELQGGPLWWVVAWHLSTWATVAAVFLGFHREAPSVPQVRWWWVAGAGAAAGAVWSWFVPLSPLGFGLAWLLTAVLVVAVRPWSAGTPGPAVPRP